MYKCFIKSTLRSRKKRGRFNRDGLPCRSSSNSFPSSGWRTQSCSQSSSHVPWKPSSLGSSGKLLLCRDHPSPRLSCWNLKPFRGTNPQHLYIDIFSLHVVPCSAFKHLIVFETNWTVSRIHSWFDCLRCFASDLLVLHVASLLDYILCSVSIHSSFKRKSARRFEPSTLGVAIFYAEC